jgi:TPR repeat protein
VFYATTKEDRQSALHWYAISARDGDSQGMNSLGNMLLDNKGDPKSQASARYWLKEAAKRSDSSAASTLDYLDKTGN